MKFGINNYFRPTPNKIQKFLVAMKSILVLLSTSAYVNNDPRLGFWLLLITGALNEFGALFTEQPESKEDQKQS